MLEQHFRMVISETDPTDSVKRADITRTLLKRYNKGPCPPKEFIQRRAKLHIIDA